MLTSISRKVLTVFAGTAIVALFLTACGGTVSFFNPSFVNFLSGGVYPVTPGPSADFVFVRAVNATDDAIRFFVTVERRQVVLDDDGNVVTDGNTNIPITEDILERVELITAPNGQASELGTLFPCSASSGPVIRVGLGENLLPTDPAAFVIPGDDYDDDNPLGPQPGFGVTAEGLNPLSFDANNFDCGDTVIFRAIVSNGAPGGVRISAFLLPGSEQPSIFTGRDTFVNYQEFLESQVREEEVP